MLRSIRLFVYPSVCPISYSSFYGYRTLIGNPMQEVKLTGQCGLGLHPSEAAMKPSPAPLQKHSLGGCTIIMSLQTAHQLFF